VTLCMGSIPERSSHACLACVQLLLMLVLLWRWLYLEACVAVVIWQRHGGVHVNGGPRGPPFGGHQRLSACQCIDSSCCGHCTLNSDCTLAVHVPANAWCTPDNEAQASG
jgi:hypothetical protein